MNHKNLRYLPARILIYLFSVLSIGATAQSKLPNIQAIGKVTLKNGQTEEGVIALGYTYDNKHFHANAFYYETPAEKHLILIDLDFSGFYSELLQGNGGGGLFYAESKSDQAQSRFNVQEAGSDRVLNKKILREENFILRKEFSLYPDLPLSLNVRAKITGKDNVKSYKIDEIASFELLKDPPADWLKKIEQAKARLKEKMETDKKGSNLWLNYQEPIWYHDIIHDNLEFARWRQFFN